MDELITMSELAASLDKSPSNISTKANRLNLPRRYVKDHVTSRRVFTMEEAKLIKHNFLPAYYKLPENLVIINNIAQELKIGKMTVYNAIADLGIPKINLYANHAQRTAIDRKYLSGIIEYVGSRLCKEHLTEQRSKYRANRRKAQGLKANTEVYYRISVRDFDGKCYVKRAGLTREEAELEIEFFRRQYVKAVAIPCGNAA